MFSGPGDSPLTSYKASKACLTDLKKQPNWIISPCKSKNQQSRTFHIILWFETNSSSSTSLTIVHFWKNLNRISSESSKMLPQELLLHRWRHGCQGGWSDLKKTILVRVWCNSCKASHWTRLKVLEQARRKVSRTCWGKGSVRIVKPTAYGSRTVRVKCCFLQHHFFHTIGMGWGGAMWTFLAHPLDSTQHACFWYVLKVHSGKIESGGKKGSVNIKHAGSKN